MSQISVLLADDNAPIRDILARALRTRFTVYEPVADGKQLVEAALVRRPDVIVSDVWMPVLNGLEAMRVLRELGRSTPFVMVSSDGGIGSDCLAAGATAFVVKTEIEGELIRAVIGAATQHLPSDLDANHPPKAGPAVPRSGADRMRGPQKL